MKKEEFDPTELEGADEEVFGAEAKPEAEGEEEPAKGAETQEGKEDKKDKEGQAQPEQEKKEQETQGQESKEKEEPTEAEATPEKPKKQTPTKQTQEKEGPKEDLFEEEEAPAKKQKETAAPIPQGASPREEPEEEPKKLEIKVPAPAPEPEPAAQPAPSKPSDGSDLRLFAIRTTVGKEATVAEFIANRAKMEKLSLASFVVPSSLKGYLLVESQGRDELVKAIAGIQHIRGIIQGEVDFSEITHYLEAKVVKDIPVKALVELVSGPFKGEKAKVVRVDKSKDAITVELIEATVPIPITVKMDAVRVLASDTSVLQAADITTKEE